MTDAPPKVEQPSAPQTAQLESAYILDLKKGVGDNHRLWIHVYQSGNTFTGFGNAGYVTADAAWIEPYSGNLIGTVIGSQVKIELPIHDYYDTNKDVKYDFMGVVSDKKLSGTWRRVFVGEDFGPDMTGNFEGVSWQ
ncbi:hypothetical protein [Deinococcus humi]|uniref:Uncharacterized protein n=1 Tax=Deinococcus humi TaxID=662880 RepID=A0A7W8K043_9DEIO|nr:hypothetical protein [Deinococcus humi]MBB5366190.1 hypothetical protein [Deinococcus humi]GGO40798.1 hypothetical protein GCM10008949_50700 [Deinococcus humi]